MLSTKYRPWIWFVVCGALFAFFTFFLQSSPVLAGEGTPPPSQDEINAIARQLYCPVCENIPLDACGTQACAQWRALIGEKLQQGWTADQIKAYFVEQYGDRVLATPPLQNQFNWLAYLVPPILILVGVFITARVLSSWQKSKAALVEPPPPAPAQDDPYRAKVEEELRRYQ